MTKNTPSTAQRVYMLARAHYDTVDQLCREQAEQEGITALMSSPDDAESERGMARYEEIEIAHQHAAAWHALQQAEQALIDWGHSVIMQRPEYARHRADLEKVFNSPLVSVRTKVLDLTLRLAA